MQTSPENVEHFFTATWEPNTGRGASPVVIITDKYFMLSYNFNFHIKRKIRLFRVCVCARAYIQFLRGFIYAVHKSGVGFSRRFFSSSSTGEAGSGNLRSGGEVMSSSSHSEENLIKQSCWIIGRCCHNTLFALYATHLLHRIENCNSNNNIVVCIYN